MRKEPWIFAVAVCMAAIACGACTFIEGIGWRASPEEIDEDLDAIEAHLDPTFSMAEVDLALYRSVFPQGAAVLDDIAAGNPGTAVFGPGLYAIYTQFYITEPWGDERDDFYDDAFDKAGFGYVPAFPPEQFAQPAAWASLSFKRTEAGGYIWVGDQDRLVRLECTWPPYSNSEGMLRPDCIDFHVAAVGEGKVHALVALKLWVEQIPRAEAVRAMRYVTYEVVYDPAALTVDSVRKFERLTARNDNEIWFEYLYE